MKTIMIAVLSALLISCSGKSTYLIHGSLADASKNGHQVLLYPFTEDQGQEALALDSVLIEGDSFELSGRVDSVGWFFLVIQDAQGERSLMGDFFMEPRVEVAEVEGRLAFTGGEINAIYQDFDRDFRALSEDLMQTMRVYQQNREDQAAFEAYSASYERFEQDMRAFSTQRVVENINNPAGMHILKSTVQYMELEDLDAVLAAASATALEQPFLQMIAEISRKAHRVIPGRPFVELEMNAPDGSPFLLSSIAGKGSYVLIDFWASWCGPCIREIPHLKTTYEAYHSKGFEIVGVSLDTDGDAWKNAIETHALSWPHMSDLAGWESAAVNLYAFSSIPHTVLLDPEGKIVAKDLRGEALSQRLEEIFGE